MSRRQDGVFSAAQLAEAGFGRRRLTRLVEQGRLVHRHHGVYADALVVPTPRSHLVAALLALGPTAFLSHRTALARYGVRPLALRRIDVTVVSGHTPRIDGVFCHRTSVAPAAEEIRVRDGLRMSSPSRALAEVAAIETDRELGRVIAELARRRLLDLVKIDAAIARRSGIAGIARLRAALARYRPSHPDVSTFERDFAAWLAADPEIPTPERNVRMGPWELDFHWLRPTYGVVAETDGEPYHHTPAERERDRVKDAWLQRHDQRILRVTGFRFAHDRAGIRQDLLGLLYGR